MARPKRRIVLVDADEVRLSVWRFVLRTWRYNVFGARTVEEAAELLCGAQMDLVVLRWPLASEEECERLLYQNATWASPAQQTLLLVEERDAQTPALLVDRVLSGAACAPQMVLEAVKLGTTRKRGPKPFRKPVSAVHTLGDALDVERFLITEGFSRRAQWAS